MFKPEAMQIVNALAYTAEDWQLRTDSVSAPRLAAAAHKINTAVRACVSAGKDRAETREIVVSLMSRLTYTGASDAGAMGVLDALLDTIYEEV